MSELLSQLQQLGDGEIDDLSIAHDASEEIVALRLRVAALVEALEAVVAYDEEVEDNDGNLMMHYSKMMRKVREALAALRKGGDAP